VEFISIKIQRAASAPLSPSYLQNICASLVPSVYRVVHGILDDPTCAFGTEDSRSPKANGLG